MKQIGILNRSKTLYLKNFLIPKYGCRKVSCGRGGRRGMERVCLKRFPDSLEKEYFNGKLSCQTLIFFFFFLIHRLFFFPPWNFLVQYYSVSTYISLCPEMLGFQFFLPYKWRSRTFRYFNAGLEQRFLQCFI